MPVFKTSPQRPQSEDMNVSRSRESSGQQSPATSDANGPDSIHFPQHLSIPAVHLDVDEISSAMAAQLTSSLVSHVLFLKSQIPFPVVQLSRMPALKADSKAAKKKMDMINAIDTLSSHLHTTFRALSTALAISQSKLPATQVSKGQAHMSIVVGPSVGVPKARVILVMSGLEVKHAGASGSKESEPFIKDQYSATEETADSEEDEGFDTGSEPEDSDSDSSDDTGDEDEDDGSSSEDSPTTPPRSAAPSPSESKVTFLEEQETLRAADRLLSRTLASACAEPDGGLSSEISATQTHILLRAPRHFDHPEWTPRQNLTRSLEKTLSGFLKGAITEPELSNATTKKSYTAGPRTEGVWIGCKGEKLHVDQDDEATTSLTEGDDMIWWTWNGKIVGFNDW